MKSLDLYSANYENTILIGDFNVSIDDPHMDSFCESYRFKCLIKDSTRFKNLKNSSCIDLILTISPYSFHNSCVIETGLSDFQKMIVSVMKTTFQKLKPRIVKYRDYTQFSNYNFRKNLLENLYLENININTNGLEKFLQICMNTLDQMAPRKKYGNNMPFFNKELSSAHTKKDATKKSLSEKEYNKIISEDKDNESTAALLNSFFSEAVKNIKTPEFSDSNPLAENIPHTIFKAILENKNHPSVLPLKTQEMDQVFVFVE